ncbi:hypothetical protein [Streptomyces carpaticus]|uniref:Uncharacterized protein n=1 Tax=Streptomyces carpaticus TaxID=285558 RepID=A0ABV4ZP11_9ACTN
MSATEESGSRSGYDSGCAYDSDREDSSGSSGDAVAADDDYGR